MKKISFMALAVLFSAAAFVNAEMPSTGVQEPVGAVACTMDAKICPDGSAVGRIGPNCEFAPCRGGAIVKPIRQDDGFMQFNNLTVQSVSGTNVPAEITATDSDYSVMMGKTESGGAQGGVGVPAMGASSQAVSSVKNCYRFSSATATKGENIPCPTAVVSSVSSSAAGMSAPEAYPMQRVYRIKIDASTKLLLRERTPATLSDFSAEDKINVFGYYNSDGTITAYMARNLTKPVVQQTLQLNNVTLVSVSGNTLAVVQETYSPCRYYQNGAPTDNIACPMGISAFESHAATKSIQKPDFISNWQAARKYVVNVDSQTAVLDRNRGKLAVSDLRIGDKLNIYGDTADNGQTITADIVRDLSLPPSVSQYSGTISAVNPDGSFAIRTDKGATITVKNPFSVGSRIKITGLLDSANILSQITQISFGESMKILPVPAPTPSPLSTIVPSSVQ